MWDWGRSQTRWKPADFPRWMPREFHLNSKRQVSRLLRANFQALAPQSLKASWLGKQPQHPGLFNTQIRFLFSFFCLLQKQVRLRPWLMIRLECNVAIIACDCAWLKAWKGPLENLTIYHEWKLQQQAKCKIYFAFFMGGIFNFVLANELCWHRIYDMHAKCNRHLSWDDPSQWFKIADLYFNYDFSKK